MKKILFSIISGLFVTALYAQQSGSVTGTITDKNSDNPLEFAIVHLQKGTDTIDFQRTTADKNGVFAFKNLPQNDYKIVYEFIGFDKNKTIPFTINNKHTKLNLGKLGLVATNHLLNEVEVTSRKSTFVNSIDRKTFNVGEDLMSKASSVSDLLQNVPSVQVDVDGNVSLRGSDNVTILIDGKPSALMNLNRAAVLQQMPANTIDKIEIITNPSAKYKPDGTAGIINIVLKKNKSLGLNGSVTVNAGNHDRYNGNLIANYNPGKLNIYGSYSIRKDDRERLNTTHTRIDSANTTIYSQIYSTSHSRPISNIVGAGASYKINDKNKIGISGNLNYRTQTQNDITTNTAQNKASIDTIDYDRFRYNPQHQTDLEGSVDFQHTFAKDGHELNFNYTTSASSETENNHYSNVYRLPLQPTTLDHTIIKQNDNESQLTAEYINPISEHKKLEAGYALESRKNDMDFLGENFNPVTSAWERDTVKTNRFIYNENIHVLYATYEQELGEFSFLAGLRAEEALIKTNQVAKNLLDKNNYFRLYPTLHLTYNISDIHQLQLNYSHRVRRPEGDDMNPFPEYQDPKNLRQGNPHLKPEDIHSVEMGYMFKKNAITFLSTVYYRYTYNSLTTITKELPNSVTLTTFENLSKSSSAGLELILSAGLGHIANINLSTNTFRNTIDASALGYSNNKSIISWTANLSAGVNLTKTTMLQLTSNYTGEKLTPQGKRLPSFVLNSGFKQEFMKKKLVFVFTVSDIFNSLRDNSIIDTPSLYREISRKRSSRMVYAGLTYSFGRQPKKQKENSIKFDNQL